MWKVEVIADNSGEWAGNAMRYETKEEAEAAARDLASRWLLVRKWRVVKTKRTIIEETVEYYSEHPRGVTVVGHCEYAVNGTHCAVGRCLIDPVEFQKVVGSSSIKKSMRLDENLKPEYRGHEIGFWKNLQMFHDNSFNWEEGGLTEDGRGIFESLLERWS